MSVDFRDMLSALQLTEAAEQLRPEWEASQQSLPATVPFLTPEFIRRACRQVYRSEALAEVALPTAERIAADEALRALAWHLHRRVFGVTVDDWDTICEWPGLEAALGLESDVFYFLVGLSGAPIMQAVHRAHQIPEEVIRATLADVDHWPLRSVPGSTEREGPAESQEHLAWAGFFFRGEIYRLGRLQYQIGAFDEGARAFRHRTLGTVVLLSGDGTRYRADGQVDPDGSATGGWQARLTVAEGEAIGNPILPVGQAVPRQVTLSLADWRQVVAPGDPALHLHIPDGGPLTPEACDDSFRRALEFFPRHFPDYRYTCFCCTSWLFNTWLETVLPPDSNILRFQREFYLFAIGMRPDSTIEAVLGQLPADLCRAPRETRLQRALLDILQAGGRIGHGGGGCLLLPEDFDWGAQVYRRQQWPFDI
jgi:hypothetical protein